MNKESPCLYFTYFKVKPIKKKKQENTYGHRKKTRVAVLMPVIQPWRKYAKGILFCITVTESLLLLVLLAKIVDAPNSHKNSLTLFGSMG